MGGEIISWHKASEAERRCLNGPVNLLRRQMNLTWQEAFQQAFGARDHVGQEYEANLRKGTIARDKAAKLYAWLERNSPTLAIEVEAAVFAVRASAKPDAAHRWEGLLSLGVFEGVRVMKVRPGLNALDFARREPVDPEKLYLLDHFLFEIDAPIAGDVLAFHGWKGDWYALPLTYSSLTLHVPRGTSIVPRDDRDRPEPLSEDANEGHHAFFFLIVGGGGKPEFDIEPTPHHPIPRTTLDRLAETVLTLPKSQVAALRSNVLFARPR